MFKKDKEKTSRLNSALQMLEKRPAVQSYFQFTRLSDTQQLAIRQEWKIYYQKVRTTQAYKRFIEQSEALRRNDLATVVKLAQEAAKDRQVGPTIKTPRMEDPNVLKNQWDVVQYHTLLSELQSIERVRKPDPKFDSFIA